MQRAYNVFVSTVVLAAVVVAAPLWLPVVAVVLVVSGWDRMWSRA